MYQRINFLVLPGMFYSDILSMVRSYVVPVYTSKQMLGLAVVCPIHVASTRPLCHVGAQF